MRKIYKRREKVYERWVLGDERFSVGQLAVGSWTVGSWQLAVGSWQLAVGQLDSWQLAVGQFRNIIKISKKFLDISGLAVGSHWS